MHILDTNICIYAIKKKPRKLLERLAETDPATVGISVVTLSELQYGVAKSRNRDQNLRALRRFLMPVQILPWDQDAALICGDIRADLESRGSPIGVFDLMIASHAMALDATVVTNNISEFRRVRGLEVENWVRGG